MFNKFPNKKEKVLFSILIFIHYFKGPPPNENKLNIKYNKLNMF